MEQTDLEKRIAQQQAAGLVNIIVNAIHEVRRTKGERVIRVGSTKGQDNVEIVIRRVPDFVSQGQKGIELL